jgi:hypothetical protein
MVRINYSSLSLWLVASGNALAAPSFTRRQNNSTGTVEPCARVSAAAATAIQAGSTDKPLIPAGDALACLKSVPLDATGNLKLIEELKMYWELQSTLDNLKTPPATAADRAVDLMGGLDLLKQRLSQGLYTNEFDFQLDVSRLVQAVHDFHFTFSPDILNVFIFQRGNPMLNLISVSSDGQSLPQVYEYGK